MTGGSLPEGNLEGAVERELRAFRVSWSRVICAGCGQRRVARVQCPDCGYRPPAHEVDPDVRSRQLMAESALAVLEQRAELPCLSDSLSIFEIIHMHVMADLSGLLHEILSSLADAAENPSMASSLIDNLTAFRERKGLVETLPHLRPWGPALRKACELFTTLEDSVKSFLAATKAATPIEAERFAAAAQLKLDCATDCIEPLYAALLMWRTPQVPSNFYEVLQARLLATLGGGDLITLERVGARRLQQIFGRNVMVQPGLGVAGLVLIEQANLVLNLQRFQQIASTAYALFRRNTNRFHAVVSSGNIRSDLARATDSLLSGSFTAHAVASSAPNEHAAVSAFLDLGRSLIEGPGRRLLAALLASTTRHEYGKLRNWNSTKLLDNVKTDRFGELFIELDNAFRDASAHQKFHIDGPHVVLHEEHPERLSVDVMVNRLLGHIEVVMGVYLALLVSASDIGKDLTDSRGLRILGLNNPEVAQFMLSLWGWQVDSIELDDECFSVRAVVDRSTPLITAVVAASTTGAFDDYPKLEFYVRSESTQHLISGPTDALLRVHREDLDRATWNTAIFGSLSRVGSI